MKTLFLTLSLLAVVAVSGKSVVDYRIEPVKEADARPFSSFDVVIDGRPFSIKTLVT